jgi:CelD/BcsL family acetyltransferase involved in cellulose biosynthesis
MGMAKNKENHGPEMNGYRISVIDSLVQWETIRATWDKMLENSPINSFFLNWEWLYSWAECFLTEKRKLFIVCIYDQDEIIGIAPWYIERISFIGTTLKRIRFLGTPESGSDYLDIAMKKGKEKEITNAVYEYLMTEASRKWDSLMLTDLPATSLFLMYFMNRIHIDGKYAEITRAAYCPIIALPDNIETFFSGLSRNRREQFRRHLKILRAIGQINHESHSVIDEEEFNTFFDLYRKNWGEEGKRLQEFVRIFASRIQNKPVLQMDLLKCNGICVAGLLHFRHKQTLLMYLMAIDKDFNPKISIGNILVGLAVQNAISQGILAYDFLKGDESYKFHWATHGSASITLLFFQRKLTPVMFAFNHLLKHVGKLILR